MMPAAFILGLYFIGVSLEHYHESNMWHYYYVTEVKFQRQAKKLNKFHLNCMRKLFKIKWKDKVITFIYIIP